MDFKENYPIENEAPRAQKKQPTGLKSYIAITVLVAVWAALLTFIITYIVLQSNYEKQKDLIKEQYTTQLDAIGEFKSIIELYNALPEEARNIEIYKKLGCTFPNGDNRFTQEWESGKKIEKADATIESLAYKLAERDGFQKPKQMQ
jgi:hypothetical protein